MNLLDLYKEHYFFEINRRHQLTSQLSIPIGILTVLGGLSAYIVKNNFMCSDDKKLLFAVLLSISSLFFIITIYYLIRSYYGYTYRFIPSPKDINDYKKQLSDYHKKLGSSEEKVELELEEFLIERYAIAAHENTWNNDSKSVFLHKANTALIYTLISLLLNASLFYYVNFNNHEKVIHKVEIINFDLLKKERILIMPNDQPPKQQQGQVQDQGQQQEQPIRPIAPPDRLIKEDTQPKDIRKK